MDWSGIIVSCVSAAALGIVGIMLRRVEKKLDARDADNAAYRAEREKRESELRERRAAEEKARNDGELALMRQQLIEHHDRVMRRGWYANDAERESIHLMFESYKALGGDGVVDRNAEEVLRLPTSPTAMQKIRAFIHGWR